MPNRRRAPAAASIELCRPTPISGYSGEWHHHLYGSGILPQLQQSRLHHWQITSHRPPAQLTWRFLRCSRFVWTENDSSCFFQAVASSPCYSSFFQSVSISIAPHPIPLLRKPRLGIQIPEQGPRDTWTNRKGVTKLLVATYLTLPPHKTARAYARLLRKLASSSSCKLDGPSVAVDESLHSPKLAYQRNQPLRL